ncbi:putative MFS transporter [Aspergillus affinis]|uniref:putative MFS transporter n=1 Tax=Aspergillus affinis TaxID=1070780 RepID=UPI0022FEBC6C|nr:putative MFS transporter [Aspergillus affinis]KAI9043741.1 putative MFS transporter [Aspergillus affinis]
MDLEADVQKKSPEKSPTQSTAETRRASWCTFGAFCCLFATMGFLNCVGCFRWIYRYKLFPNYTSFHLSWIFSVQRACFWAFGPLYGRLFDMYGPGVIIWPLVGTCVVEVFAMSLDQEYWYIMMTQGILFGIAAGGVYTAALLSMGQWFDRRLGLVAGIAACGSSLGGIFYPILLQWAMKQASFEIAMQYTALLIGIALIPALFLVKGRLPITGWDRNAKWFDLTPFRQRHYPYFIVGSFLTM